MGAWNNRYFFSRSSGGWKVWDQEADWFGSCWELSCWLAPLSCVLIWQNKSSSSKVQTHLDWRRQWQPTPVLLTGKSHGWRSLVGYSPRGRKESDTTEQLHFHFFSVISLIFLLIPHRLIPRFKVQRTWMSQVLYSNECSTNPHLPLFRDRSELIASSVQAEEVRD